MSIQGQTITDLQNMAFSNIIDNINIVKALVINTEDFINTTPTPEQQIIINDPSMLIRKQLFPYKKVTLATGENAKPYITSTWINFKKEGFVYRSGIVYFYIIIPVSLEKTIMGIRYNYIADKLDELFCEGGIGKFEYYDRGDFDVTDGYLGHYIAFRILDFKSNERDNNV